MALYDILKENIEKVGRIGGTSRSFRMKLGGEKWFFKVLHSLIGVVVEVDK